MNNVFVILENVNWDRFTSSQLEFIQQSQVVAVEPYFDDTFLDVGIIPNVYMGETLPDVLLGTGVKYLKGNSMSNLLTFVFDYYPPRTHLRLIGHRTAYRYLKAADEVVLLEDMFEYDMGLSIVDDGVEQRHSALIPVYGVMSNTEEADIKLPSLTKQASNFAKSALKEFGKIIMGTPAVSASEKARSWNTCLTGPFLDPTNHCTKCVCPMETKITYRGATCGNKEKPLW